MKNANKIRQLLERARDATLQPFVHLKIKQALALLPCETCNDTGNKPRSKGERHCLLRVCNSETATTAVCPDDCPEYIAPEPCPVCNPYPCSDCKEKP